MAQDHALLLDLFACFVFLTCWLGYDVLASQEGRKRPSLIDRVRVYRERWIQRSCERDNHVADATLLSNLLRGALFFASTTVLILGGLVALLGATPQATEVAKQLSFGSTDPARLAAVKTLGLILLFVFAFFKFTWSAWQYNILSIMMGAAPELGNAVEKPRFVRSASLIAALAGESYNKGIRAYYFATALLTWYLGPVALIVATLVVTWVIYRREFFSPTLAAFADAPTDAQAKS